MDAQGSLARGDLVLDCRTRVSHEPRDLKDDGRLVGAATRHRTSCRTEWEAGCDEDTQGTREASPDDVAPGTLRRAACPRGRPRPARAALVRRLRETPARPRPALARPASARLPARG